MASLVRTNLFRASRMPLNPLKRTIPIASFHSSRQLQLLPPMPQQVHGSVNTPAPVPHTSPAHGSYHWTFERLISVALIPVTVAPFAAGALNPIMDATLAALILVHTHIGFQALITDYLPTWQVPKTRKLFDWLLRLGTLTVAVGLYEFETNDVGLTETIKRIWHA